MFGTCQPYHRGKTAKQNYSIAPEVSTQMWRFASAYIPLAKTSHVAMPDVPAAVNTLFQQKEASEKDPIEGGRRYFGQIIKSATCSTPSFCLLQWSSLAWTRPDKSPPATTQNDISVQVFTVIWIESLSLSIFKFRERIWLAQLEWGISWWCSRSWPHPFGEVDAED